MLKISDVTLASHQWSTHHPKGVEPTKIERLVRGLLRNLASTWDVINMMEWDISISWVGIGATNLPEAAVYVGRLGLSGKELADDLMKSSQDLTLTTLWKVAHRIGVRAVRWFITAGAVFLFVARQMLFTFSMVQWRFTRTALGVCYLGIGLYEVGRQMVAAARTSLRGRVGTVQSALFCMQVARSALLVAVGALALATLFSPTPLPFIAGALCTAGIIGFSLSIVLTRRYGETLCPS